MSEPEKTVEVEAADSTSDMASSPVTAEDTTVTSVIDETSVHVYTTDNDSIVTESSEINDHLEPNTCDTDKDNAPPPTNDYNKNCSRCTKRRLAEVDSYQENTKKARVEACLMERIEQWILPDNRVQYISGVCTSAEIKSWNRQLPNFLCLCVVIQTNNS